MDQSLDDIIRKKFHKNSLRGKGGFKKFGGSAGITRTNHHNTLTRRPGNIPQRRVGPLSPPGIQMAITDARNRIIQKKRQNLTDARDKLCELAKQTDARQKLEKLRERRLGREGIAQEIGFNGNFAKNALTGVRGRTGFSPAAVKLQRTINQPVYKHSQFPPKVPALMDMDMDVELNDGYIPDGPLHLRRTVNNDQMRASLIRPSKLSQSSPYSWKAPQPRQPQSTSRGYIDLDYPMEERKRMKLPSPPPMMRPIQLSDDELMEPVRPVARSSRLPSGSTAGVKTRLETSRAQQHSSTSATGPSGYRIVVSNLQSTVTHEDIRELFEDVGPLLTSRLVRPGTAEVVYRQYKDAERAVENYHNRQLDGQPMKCLLVKPRPSTASSAATNVRTSVGPSSKLSGSGKSSVVPDISTIHKALFNRS